jgi:predicted transcriptional regulator
MTRRKSHNSQQAQHPGAQQRPSVAQLDALPDHIRPALLAAADALAQRLLEAANEAMRDGSPERLLAIRQRADLEDIRAQHGIRGLAELARGIVAAHEAERLAWGVGNGESDGGGSALAEFLAAIDARKGAGSDE